MRCNNLHEDTLKPSETTSPTEKCPSESVANLTCFSPPLCLSLCHCVNTNERWAVITKALDDSVWLMYHSSFSVCCQRQDVFSYRGNEMSNADSKLWWCSNIRYHLKLRWTARCPFPNPLCVQIYFTAVQITNYGGGVCLFVGISWKIIPPTVFDQRRMFLTQLNCNSWGLLPFCLAH